MRVPFVFVEVDNSRAGSSIGTLPYKALIIGQKLSSGAMAANTFERVTSPAQAAIKAGVGSMLHRQAIAWFKNNSTTEVYLGALDDAVGTAASGSVAFTGPATESGAINCYIGGERIAVGVAVSDAADDIAAALSAAINARTDLPVSAEINGSASEQVDLTFAHDGEVGNSLDIRFNYYDGESFPAGVAATIAPLASGAINPDVTGLLAALGDEWFHIFAMPYTDASTLADMEAELVDRFGPLRMIDGVCFTATAANHSTAGTLGDSRNSPHVSIVGTNNSPTPVYEYAAAIAAKVAYHGEIDPARPFQTLVLSNVMQPAVSDQWTLQERNLLLYDGISTTRPAAGGAVIIENLITTYKENSSGAPDESYLQVNTLLTLMFIRYDFRNYILQKYPRHKLANDGTRFGPGQAIITPKVGKAEAIARFREWELLGLVENVDQFKAELVVERSASNPNRLDFLLPPDLINQFRVAGIQIGFLLQG